MSAWVGDVSLYQGVDLPGELYDYENQQAEIALALEQDAADKETKNA